MYIMAILLAALTIATPAVDPMCLDLYGTMLEAVADGIIPREKADELYQKCIRHETSNPRVTWCGWSPYSLCPVNLPSVANICRIVINE